VLRNTSTSAIDDPPVGVITTDTTAGATGIARGRGLRPRRRYGRAVSIRPTARDLWKRGQRGWPASFPLAQLPNPPLLAALAGWLVAAPTRGLVHDCARATFYTGLAAWAWKELDDGVNWVRRGIGAAALLFVSARITEALRT
jgi:hypothetical protein